MPVYQNVLETVGSTPIIKLNRMGPEGVEIYVKAEAFNPMGSVKDRLALGVIEAAEEAGTLRPGQTVVEAAPHKAPDCSICSRRALRSAVPLLSFFCAFFSVVAKA